MDKQDFLNRIVQSMNESQEESLRSLGRPSSCATREQAIKQVETNEELSVQSTTEFGRGPMPQSGYVPKAFC